MNEHRDKNITLWIEFTPYMPPGYINKYFSWTAQPEQIKPYDSYLSINPWTVARFSNTARAVWTIEETNGADKVHYLLLTHRSGIRPNLSPAAWPVRDLALLQPLIRSEVNVLPLYDKSSVRGEKASPHLARREIRTLSFSPKIQHLAHTTEPWLRRKRAHRKINIINPQLKSCSLSWHPLLFSYLCPITTCWSNYGCIKK